MGDRSVYPDDLKFYRVEPMAADFPDPYRFNTFGNLLECPALALKEGALSGTGKSLDWRKELSLAEGLGYNLVRILMQFLVWENNPESYKRHFSKFLEPAAKHALSVMPQFFGDCAFGLQPDTWKRHHPYIGKQADPIPGVFLSNWSPSPGHSRVRDRSGWPRLKAYGQDFLKTYGNDPRV